VLLDNGHSVCSPTRSDGRRLHCIRCSACLNVCPRVCPDGRSRVRLLVYPGPIGAILTRSFAASTTRVTGRCVQPVRRLLRGLPGEDRHPRRPAAPPAEAERASRSVPRCEHWRRVRARPAHERAQRLPGRRDALRGISGAIAGGPRWRPRPLPKESFREWWSREPARDRDPRADARRDRERSSPSRPCAPTARAGKKNARPDAPASRCCATGWSTIARASEHDLGRGVEELGSARMASRVCRGLAAAERRRGPRAERERARCRLEASSPAAPSAIGGDRHARARRRGPAEGRAGADARARPASLRRAHRSGRGDGPGGVRRAAGLERPP